MCMIIDTFCILLLEASIAMMPTLPLVVAPEVAVLTTCLASAIIASEIWHHGNSRFSV